MDITSVQKFCNDIEHSAVEITVTANSKRNNLSWDEKKNRYLLGIKEPAENNRANDEIVRYLGKLCGKKLRIVTGKTSSKKLVKLD